MAGNYENKKRTIGNKQFPVKATFEDLLNSKLFVLALATAAKSDDACLVFWAIPVLPPATERDLSAQLVAATVDESVVTWMVDDGSGRAVVVPIPPSMSKHCVAFVMSADDMASIVGVQFLVETEVVAAHCL